MRRKNTSYWSLSCDHGRYCSDELYCDNNHNNNDNNNCCYSTAVVPKMQQAKCSVHVMYILLLYTRTAVVVDGHNEEPGIDTVGIRLYLVRTMIYDWSTHKRSIFCHTCVASHNTWLTGPAVKWKGARIIALYKDRAAPPIGGPALDDSGVKTVQWRERKGYDSYQEVEVYIYV